MSGPIIELIPWGEMTGRQQWRVESAAGVVFEHFYESPNRALFLCHWARESAAAHGADYTIDDLLDKLDFQALMDMIAGMPDDQGLTLPPASGETDARPPPANGSVPSPPSPAPSAQTPSPSSTRPPRS